MELSTEQLTLIRDEYVRDQDRFIYAPESVKWRTEFLISVLTELLELREIVREIPITGRVG